MNVHVHKHSGPAFNFAFNPNSNLPIFISVLYIKYILIVDALLEVRQEVLDDLGDYEILLCSLILKFSVHTRVSSVSIIGTPTVVGGVGLLVLQIRWEYFSKQVSVINRAL